MQNLPVIDAHAHVDGDHAESAAAFAELNVRLLNVALAWDETDKWKGASEAYMYGRPGAPSHEETMAARDRLVEKHPKLKVIGAHLASLEHDMKGIAARFDRYPNFAIDTSARVMDLAAWGGGACDFCVKYQDRILFGTDLGSDGPHSKMDGKERARAIATAKRAYDLSRSFFTSPDDMEWGWWDEKKRIRGLGLPADVAAKILSGNALRWIPGLAAR